MRFIIGIIVSLILVIYHPWFQISKSLSGGDWPYLYIENIQAFQLFHPPFLWLEPYYQITSKIGVEYLSLSWELTEKIFWFYPFLFISIISSFILINSILKSILPQSNYLALPAIGSLIFTSNTYILMVVGGGQMGVAMAYAFAPLVLYLLVNQSDKKLRNFFKGLVISSIQLMFDPRIWLLTIFIACFYFLFNYILKKEMTHVRKNIVIILGSFVVNSFWILPNIFSYTKEYSDVKATSDVSFLSVASFSNTVSLLHPNWPENLFGKVYFMRPEFLFIPLIAFLWIVIEKTKNKNILFFSLMVLLGSFLAKGTQPPFGEIYQFLYAVPGFTLFRDSTKWYLLTIIAYSILIPYSLESAVEKIQSRFSFATNKQSIFLCAIVLFAGIWFWFLFPSLTGSLHGTFNPKTVPLEYLDYKKFLLEKPESFNTLWIPHYQRFGFHSKNHKAIDGSDFFGTSNTKKIIIQLKEQDALDTLRKKGIKYIVIPYDSEKELFLNNYKYDEAFRDILVSQLDSIVFLKKLPLFNGKITIYEI